jgi:DNA end-binding protein Ku
MPRPLWSGSISFGLVNIPVKLFKAQSPKDIRFHQLHAKDGVRIQQKRVCPADGEEVAYDEIVKGYELSSDQYVVIDPDELNTLDPKATHTIDIEDFVDLDQIDPLFYENGYHVVPDARAEKSYALLATAMENTNKVAIAKFVMRTKEYLCAVRVKDGALVLATMLFADEVVAVEDVLPDGMDELEAPTKKELAIATQLIESLAGDFEPDKYHDEYREKVMELIDAKAEGNEIVKQPEAPEPAPVVDLMAALEASLEKAKKAKAGSKAATAGATGEKRRAHA